LWSRTSSLKKKKPSPNTDFKNFIREVKIDIKCYNNLTCKFENKKTKVGYERKFIKEFIIFIFVAYKMVEN
jgi:hypothetical protein